MTLDEQNRFLANRKCVKCIFWKEGAPNVSKGICRKSIPSTWFQTNYDDWCGEFEINQVQCSECPEFL